MNTSNSRSVSQGPAREETPQQWMIDAVEEWFGETHGPALGDMKQSLAETIAQHYSSAMRVLESSQSPTKGGIIARLANKVARVYDIQLDDEDQDVVKEGSLTWGITAAYDAGARSVVVAPQTEVNRLRDAAARFYANRGYHTGPHDFSSGACRLCEEAYIAAESEFDTAFGLSGPRDEVLAGVAAIRSTKGGK